MAISVFDIGNRSFNQHYWRNVCQYLAIGLFALFLAACSSSKNKVPEFTSDAAISVPEGTTATGYTVTATDANRKANLTFSVTGGADQAQFSIDGTTGGLSFVTAPEFINPADANGDNVYEVQLTVDDGRKNGTATLDLTVTVTSVNLDPVFTSAATANVSEGSTSTGYTATADDPNADTLTFTISGGADQAQFSIDSATGVLSFVAAPDFAAPADANTDNDYEVQLTADDGRTGTATLDLVVTVLEQSNFSLEVTFPTPNANLGGSATQTTVAGNIIDSNGIPIDLADIDYVDVDGVMAVLDAVNPGRWSVQVPVAAGPNTLNLELGLTSGSVVNSSVDIHNFAVHPGFGRMEIDSANNRALLIDFWIDGVVEVDLTTGERSVLSGAGVGAGTPFSSPRDVALDSANNRVLVPDWRLDALFAVDLATGDRTIVSNASAGTGVALDGAFAVALDSANNRALVIVSTNNEIVAVDLVTGNRTLFSGVGTGAGPDFMYPDDVVIDSANNRAIVMDGGLEAILAVDLSNGDRSVISDAVTGTGPSISSVVAIDLDPANNRLLTGDSRGALLAVDLATGDRTEIAEVGTEFGLNATNFTGVAFDGANNRALTADHTLDTIFAFDLATGNHSVLSDSSTGSGSPDTGMWGVRGIAYDRANSRLLLTNWQKDLVASVDLGSGDRSVVSSDSIGTGPQLGWPERIILDSDNNRAVFPDRTLNALIAMDLDSGDRTVLSDGVSVGSGPAFGNPVDVVVDSANDRAAVLDQSAGVFAVDLTTGDRSIVSDGATGSGPMWSFPDSLDVDIASDMGYVADDGDTAIYKVDMATGDRSILSDNAGVGTGPRIDFPNDLILDVASNRALILNRGARTEIMAVDLSSGDRSVVSGSGVGSGQSFLSPHYIDLDLPNNRAFVYDLAVTGVLVIELSTGERAVVSK